MSFDEKLIICVQKYPILYKKNVGIKKNVAMKCQIWNSIGAELSESAVTCEKRWKCLRDRYGREEKKLLQVPSGSGVGSSNPWDWEHFEALGFLKGHIKPRHRDKFLVNDDQTSSPYCHTSIQEEVGSDTYTLDNMYKAEMEGAVGDFSELSNNVDNSLEQKNELFRSPIPQTPKPAKKKRSNDDLDSKLVEKTGIFKNHSLKSKLTSTLPAEEIDNTAFMQSATLLIDKITSTLTAEETVNTTFMKSATLLIDSLQPINQIHARKHIMDYLCDLQLKEIQN